MTFNGRQTNGHMPRCRVVNVTATSGSGSLAVTFAVPFATIPAVQLTCGTGGWIATFSNVTTTGCTINVVHRTSSSNATVPVAYFAHEVDA